MSMTRKKSRSGQCGALAIVAGLIVLHAPGAQAQADQAFTEGAHVRGEHDAPHMAQALQPMDRQRARSPEWPSTLDSANDTAAAPAARDSGRNPAVSGNALYR